MLLYDVLDWVLGLVRTPAPSTAPDALAVSRGSRQELELHMTKGGVTNGRGAWRSFALLCSAHEDHGDAQTLFGRFEDWHARTHEGVSLRALLYCLLGFV